MYRTSCDCHILSYMTWLLASVFSMCYLMVQLQGGVPLNLD